ncbi:MAG: DUF3800 domain-containing protein [Candidatus Paceibacterota bacterium]
MQEKRLATHRFFLDETGDHGLTFIDEQFPIFLLQGILFSEVEYVRVCEIVKAMKQEFFGSDGVILHSRDIRKCEGAFQVLFDLELKQKFYTTLNKILKEAEYTIIAVAIDKKRHIEKYGKSAQNPYTICLSFMMERLIFTLDAFSGNATVAIDIEKRGKREDGELLAHYNSIVDRGTYHVDSTRFKSRITDFMMQSKRENEIGLQIADLCAYPVARHVLNKEEPYIPFEIIRTKLRHNSNGKIDGYGLKVFP